MLKLADIKFPITIYSRGVGHYTFTHSDDMGEILTTEGRKTRSIVSLQKLIDLHNFHNKNNGDYSYAMVGYVSPGYRPYPGQSLPVKENKQFLLDSEEIVYPITFETVGGSVVTFTSRDNGTYGNGLRSSYNVDYFVSCHNMANPNNNKNKVYYVRDIERQWPKKDAPLGGGKTSIQKIIGEEIHKAAVEMKAPGGWRIDKSAFAYQEIVTQGAIEDMPVSATLKGVQLDDGVWFEVTAKPKTIEIHDDVVILLLHYGSTKNQTVAGEISIKRGTMVKWKVKV